MPVHFTVDQRALQTVTRALKEQEDGKQLRRELAKNIREAVKPAMAQARSNLMAVSTVGSASATPALRTTVLGQMKAQARLSGRATGASVKVRRRGPRGFELAARRLNRSKGWRHPLFGNTRVWVKQVARPVEWFDRAMRDSKDDGRRAVVAAAAEMARRIANRSRKGI
jgi:hypothetical protein